MKRDIRNQKGALIILIEKGLKIWIKSKCNKIKDLELNINGLDISFLKGKLSRINVKGKEINFQYLPINHIELTSSEINIELKELYKIHIKENFEVFGKLEFNGYLLKEALLSDRWKFLGEWFSSELLGMKYLIDLKINNQEMEIEATDEKQSYIKKSHFRVSQKSGKLLFTNLADKVENFLPADQSIKIDDVFLNKGNLLIKGKAIITP